MADNTSRGQLADLRHALMRQLWDSWDLKGVGLTVDTLGAANAILGNAELLDALAAYRGWRPPARVAELEQGCGYVVLCGDFDYEDVQLVGERVFADLEFALDTADGAGGTVYELREVNDRG
ncbi:hypothetical protein [Nocardia sp. NPDC059239]|uniref:hypothetical protein n=1 Tax=unclassified Nocardia TaxID=2637762 RepID=UPI0036844BFE